MIFSPASWNQPQSWSAAYNLVMQYENILPLLEHRCDQLHCGGCGVDVVWLPEYQFTMSLDVTASTNLALLDRMLRAGLFSPSRHDPLNFNDTFIVGKDSSVVWWANQEVRA